MTKEQKTNLRNALTANLEGKPVQARSDVEEGWYDVENPSFSSDYEWREKRNYEPPKIS
jgi:hypothetical protein